MRSAKDIKAALKSIDATFDLVMINERMPESLVLLADLLCMPLEGVATMCKKHTRQKEQPAQQTNVLKEYLGPDKLLYNHFAERLEEKIE